ncbi:MAG: molybdopterin-synthase adenylyltransferase MoeB [Acidimicrobiia bacterium]|jgi:molybdopterin/thiamine biosynthesis adenylyltransferase/rhodanese-related sulfurtransferase|nr:molybdopterin-synthase adenylyltransferase MoeB [Acidimicrobiia bacterium]
MPTFKELVAAAREQIREVTPEEAEAAFDRAVFVDVRESDEYELGAIAGAVHIARGVLESTVTTRIPDPATEVILYCAVGERSALAARALQELGYANVSSLAGGVERWKREGRRWDTPLTLRADQRSRYSRHLLLPEVGEAGQSRLLDARVLLVGAGGLGSPAAMYLAAAGVGTLGIIDHDVVDVSNLQRQILHGVDRIGSPKVESARQTLRNINPDVNVVTYKERLSADNAVDLVSRHDVIVDGADNFPTRYLLNDASLHARRPVVHGSVFRFEGQATVFEPYAGPCYRCLSAQPPPADLAPSCAEAGVLGTLPGIIGSIQALEVLKLLLGIGDPLVGTLLVFDALDGEFRRLTFRRDPRCPACADEAAPPRIVEYDEYCLPAERS